MHFPLMLIAPPVGAIASSILVIVNSDRLKAIDAYIGIMSIGAFILVAGVIRCLFSSVFHADCPQCHAELNIQGQLPITYHCTKCGFFRKTWISEGDN
jgi:hypothetical protein